MNTIRRLQPSEYEAALAFIPTLEPSRTDTVMEWQRADAGSALAVRRWVAIDEESQQIVGYGAYRQVGDYKFRLDLVVPSEQSVASRLLDVLLDSLRSIGARTLLARVPEDNTMLLSLLRQYGFIEIHRMYRFSLDVAQANLESLQAYLTCIEAQDISISTLADEQEQNHECWQMLADLQNSALPDWPNPDPGAIPYTTPIIFRRQLLGDYPVIPAAFFIAKKQGQHAGYSGLAEVESKPTYLASGGTAVRPEYRGMKLATVLKMLGIRYAQRHGYGKIITDSANPAIIKINEQLGFRRERGEVRLIKYLLEDSGE